MSLFRRVTRHRIGTKQDPRENRLTEVTAAVLERVDGLAYDVTEAVVASAATLANDRVFDAESAKEAEAWQGTLERLEDLLARLRGLPAPRLRVDTQRTTASGKFVDLELRLLPPPFQPGETFLFWVEVKHGAGIHGTQLTDYQTDIALEAADQRFVLMVAPRQSLPAISDLPEAMPVVEWQAVAEVVRRWSKRADLGEVERFLLTDYLAYLREEGLMDEELLMAEHAFALRAEPAAAGAVAKVMELADDYIANNWGPRGEKRGGKSPNYGLRYYAHYPLAPGGDESSPGWRSTVFEWSLVSDTSRDEPRNAWVFAAGATFLTQKDSPATIPENADWLTDRRKDGFEYVNDFYWRLFRFRYPEELLAATTLDGQVELLGGWVVDSFQLLAASPPRH